MIISVQSGHLDGPWQGHFPVTSVAMMAVLDRVVAGEENFKSAERILFVACEFWAAFNGNELDSYFDLKKDDPTRDARIAMGIVGAIGVAHTLVQGCLGPAGGRAANRRKRQLVQLDESLRRLDETVDLLIARFAWRYLASQHRSDSYLASATPETAGVTHFGA